LKIITPSRPSPPAVDGVLVAEVVAKGEAEIGIRKSTSSCPLPAPTTSVRSRQSYRATLDFAVGVLAVSKQPYAALGAGQIHVVARCRAASPSFARAAWSRRADRDLSHLPEPAMPPYEAARHLVRNNVDYLPIDEIEGRVAATLFVVYPHGIATIVPGERLGRQARPMIDHLKAFERSSNLFPGFETEIQGVYREADAAGKTRFHTYVVRE
jgi:hypothetical protein